MVAWWRFLFIEDNVDKCSELLSTGKDIEEEDEHGDSPLVLAIRYGRDKVFRLLISKGADVNHLSTRLYRFPPLHTAAFHGRLDYCKVLLSKGADVNQRNEGKDIFFIVYLMYNGRYQGILHLGRFYYIFIWGFFIALSTGGKTNHGSGYSRIITALDIYLLN